MALKVIYTQYRRIKEFLHDENDYYILTEDSWDDYNFRTTFNVHVIKNKELYNDNSRRKILFEDQIELEYSYNRFNEYMSEHGLQYFDFSEHQLPKKFISLGNDYDYIKKLFVEINVYDAILENINDVVFLKKRGDENNLLAIERDHNAFEVSLCRDQSAKKLLVEAKTILYGDELSPDRFNMDFSFKLDNKQYDYNFDFIKDKLPYRINLLIGRNGVGKSQTLKVLSNYLINPAKYAEKYSIDASNHPSFISNLIVFAYNVYEDFMILKTNTNTSIEYKYNGFKRFEGDNIFLDVNTPTLDSFNSFKDIYKKDRKNFSHTIKIYDQYLLKRAFDFIKSAINDLAYLSIRFKNHSLVSKYIEKIKIIEDEDLNDYYALDFNDSDFKLTDIDFSDFEEEVYFISEEKKVLPLSSGQRVFCNFVINLLSIIKNNSLVVIDEPETALHPNLEIKFIKLLNEILNEFDSFAIIATHSAVITREIPTKYVKVINIIDEISIDVSSPSINTFGADIGTISNYVFNDILVKEKPHLNWLKDQKETYNTKENFIREFKGILSYDFMVTCINSWDDL